MQRIPYALKGALRFVVDSPSGHDEQPVVHPIKILTSIAAGEPQCCACA
jgi:hypothetical protein